MNSTPGQKRLMKVRIWNKVGRAEMLNCVRLSLNSLAGVDFAMPVSGPFAHKSVEWHFAGDNQTRVNNSETRNIQKFVDFEFPPAGKDRSPKSKRPMRTENHRCISLAHRKFLPSFIKNIRLRLKKS